jgi:hypothetical protein
MKGTVRNVPNLWTMSSSSDRRALDIVDGCGEWELFGPHYSRRTPGSKTFTGVGQEVVLVRPGAVWAVVRNRLPAPRGSGASRGRTGEIRKDRYMWRNMMFRNLSDDLSSDLIRSAVARTAREWLARYGEIPMETLQTEVRRSAVSSEIPGYCYIRAGWVKTGESRGLVRFRCPRTQIERSLNN